MFSIRRAPARAASRPDQAPAASTTWSAVTDRSREDDATPRSDADTEVVVDLREPEPPTPDVEESEPDDEFAETA